MSDNDDFDRLTGPFRRELLVHCYRMLGSVDDAEDQVQETYLRAWRRYEDFEGRSSLRTWLYRIATNACLTALGRRDRWPLPTGLGGPEEEPNRLAAIGPGGAWPQSPAEHPYVFGTEPADPATIVLSRHSMRLALVAALNYLPARQCVVLILRDVLQWRASEVAELLGTTTAAVNSALQRARAQLEAVAPVEDDVADRPAQRELLDRYVAAVESADTEALTGLLSDGAVWEMPPAPLWLVGREVIGQFVDSQCPATPGDNLLVAITGYGQPAYGAYLRDADGVHRAHALKVLTLADNGISRIVTYRDPELFPLFGLPPEYPSIEALVEPLVEPAPPTVPIGSTR